MSESREAERDAASEQAFRNRVAILVVGAIVVALAALYAALLPGAEGVLSGVCAFAVLAAVFVAWEYLMKPGYGLLHRRLDAESEEPTAARKRPRSPGPP